MNQPDPQKTIYLKANQRRLPAKQRRQKQTAVQPQWEPHPGDQALDACCAALRDMRRAGKWGGSESERKRQDNALVLSLTLLQFQILFPLCSYSSSRSKALAHKEKNDDNHSF